MLFYEILNHNYSIKSWHPDYYKNNRYMENVVVYDCGKNAGNARKYGLTWVATAANLQWQFKNVVSICPSATAAWQYSDTLDNITYSCGANDTSVPDARGNLRNLVAADIFLSLDDTSADFLKINTASALFGAGTTPSIADNTTDIEGNPRPNGWGSVSIGAHEPLKPPYPSKGVAMEFACGAVSAGGGVGYQFACGAVSPGGGVGIEFANGGF
jgi:hypothetical protein